ncbi:cathepsin L [Salvia divinorum]|uniref:Cathepsin L n=1 Tax=Salvia divinorum TaxID=28513 RepID=A0ABD1HD78_SALDI
MLPFCVAISWALESEWSCCGVDGSSKANAFPKSITHSQVSTFLSFHAVICWALGTISGIEAWTHLKYGEKSKLSTQELLNCCYRDPENYGSKTVDKYKFYTGSALEAFGWVERNGIQLQDDYKWEGELGESGHEIISTDEESLLTALNKGPVVGAILFDPCIADLEKSSWGIRWGESGYGRILRESSYSKKRTPPSDLICNTRIPSLIHKVVEGHTKRVTNFIDVDDVVKPLVIKEYLEPAIDNYNYNNGTHLTKFITK